MAILTGIICFHLLVLYRSKKAVEDGLPYGSIFVLSVLTAVYVLYMLFNMDVPTQ